MPTYIWFNEETEERVEIHRSLADINIPPSPREGWVRVMTAPPRRRHSYVDGQRRSSTSKEGETFRRLEEAASLKIDYATAAGGSKEREILGREINNLEKV